MMYLFRLGHQPTISQAEIFIILKTRGIFFTLESVNDEYLLLSTSEALACEDIVMQLGGTVWLAEKVIELELGQSPEEAAAIYLDQSSKIGKINYSLRGGDAKLIALKVKTILKEYKRSVRYIESKNTATIIHNGLLESGSDLTLYKNGLFATRAVQAMDEFSEREYGKPCVDAKSGMLPPKLARIMINLSGKKLAHATLLDPFCGSGVLLMEAMSLGCGEIIGSDIAKKAVEDSKQNIAWLQNKSRNINSKLEVFECDVRGITNKVEKDSVDVIATEPLLGKPLRGRESRVDLERQAQELADLYREAFGQFKRILKPNGVIVCIIPRFRYHESWVDVPCLEQIRNMGFTIVPLAKEQDSLLYWRKGQFVGREIWKFTNQS
jgi:tRNA G10  N-methylase Trm11